MKRVLLIFIALLTYSINWAVNFKQVAYIDKGAWEGYGIVKTYDTNHDGNKEIITSCRTQVAPLEAVYSYEYKGYNTYILGDTIWAGTPYPFVWDVNEADGDGFTDLTMQNNNASNNIYESIDYISYPKQIVWNYNTQTISVAPTYMYDLDRDGKYDILTVDVGLESLFVFENNGDNQYNIVWTYNGTGLAEAWSTFAIGDFDGDSLTEFVTGTSGGKMILWEHTGLDNQYQQVWFDSIVAYNSYNNINIGDITQDGKPEFVIGSFYNSGFNWRAKWSFFKAIGDNQYAKFYEDSLYDNHGLGDYYAASYSGDIDGDGHPEAVLARNNNWLVYKWDGSQVQRIFKAYATDNGRDNTVITVTDMNGNGYDEIIESGSIDSAGFTIGGETRIWEIMGEVTWDSLTAVNKDSCIQIKWSTTKQFANYGFNLWRAVGADSNYSIIHNTNDTVRLDTLLHSYTFNDSNVTTGLTYYYKVQAKTLNDSTLFFGPVNVLYTGISGKPWEPVIAYSFKLGQNAPNPFSHTTAIKYQIPQAVNVSLKVYNVAGQLVKVLMNEGTSPSNSSPRGEGRVGSITWDGRDQNNRNVSNGVYFYQLQAGKDSDIKKMVIIK
jgi:hypothetical protein